MARAILIYYCVVLSASLLATKVCARTSESALLADDIMCTRAGGAQDCALNALQRALPRAAGKVSQLSVSTAFPAAWTSGRSNWDATATEYGAANLEVAVEILRDEKHHAQEGASASRVILHVGPPKAGSTTIQEETLRLRDPLRKDGIEVLVTRDFVPPGSPRSQSADTELNMWHVESCFDNGCACGDWSVNPACASLPIYRKLELCTFRLNYQDLSYARRYICPKLGENLDRFANQHRIFLSGETFADVQNISLLASTLKGIKTTIIVVYRPFYELLASAYREIERDVQIKSNGLLDIQSDGILGLSFNSFATTEYMQYAFGQHSVWAVYQRYRQFFHDVRVHTLSDELLPKIICEDLGAAGTCKTVHGNASLERHHVLWTANFTGRCLDAEQLDLLLKLSLEERSLLGHVLTDDTSESWESAFMQAFNQSYSSCFGVR